MILFYFVQRLLALVSLAILAAGAYLVWSWQELERAIGDFDVLEGGDDWRLYVGAGCFAVSVLGKFLILPLLASGGDAGHRLERAEPRHLTTPDRSCLRVETYGEKDAPALVFTHGWGMDATMWADARRQLGDRFRLVTWDLPGIGGSKGPKDRHYTIERFAEALRQVVNETGGPVVLVGHSIGGMTVQTFCRLHPEMLGREVAGVVLENTTHTNPLHTMVLGGLARALRWPVIEPMMRLDILLKPLVWLMAWQSYLSGSTHLAFRLVGFGARPTRAQLEQSALLATRNDPAVQAKGNLAMMRWDVSPALPSMNVPALVFAGSRDLITKEEASELIASAMPQARLLVIEGAGHMGPLEKAEAYNRVIGEFAAEVLMRGAPSDLAAPHLDAGAAPPEPREPRTWSTGEADLRLH